MNSKSKHAGNASRNSSLSQFDSSVGASGSLPDPVLPDDILPLRLKSVARITDVSEKTVRRWIERGLLRSHKLGGARVVRKRDLRTFLDQQAGETEKALA